jgi:hypothetical protein
MQDQDPSEITLSTARLSIANLEGAIIVFTDQAALPVPPNLAPLQRFYAELGAALRAERRRRLESS